MEFISIGKPLTEEGQIRSLEEYVNSRTFYVHGRGVLTGYLHFENGKRVWEEYAQWFTKEEIDEVLSQIPSYLMWECFDLNHKLYRENI